MLSQFQSSYQRVEAALDRLTQSVASYDPSTAAADDLVAADDAVSEDLKTSLHQSNHVRIQDLRQTTESLDETIKSTVRLLADTHKELAAIPSSSSPDARRDVKIDDLLSYAKFISKTTVPPTYRKPLPERLLPNAGESDAASMLLSNGIALTAGTQEIERQGESHGLKNVGIFSLDQSAKDWLDPLSKLDFVPWPSQEVIAGGALANIQRMLEAGTDPVSVLSAEEQDAEAERKKVQEEAERLEQEKRERRRMSFFGDAARRARTRDNDVFDPDEA